MHEGVIVVKGKDQEVPKAFWEKLYTQKPTAFGAAFVSNDDGKTKIVTQKASRVPSLENLMEVQTQFKDMPMIFFFGKFPEGSLEEDLQPFSLIRDAEGNDLTIAFVEGEFAGLKKPGTTHSAEFFVSDLLSRKLQKIYNMVGSDMDKLVEECTDPLFGDELKSMSNNRGTILLFFRDKENTVLSFDKGDLSMFEWGSVSQTFGYSEGSFPEKKVEEKSTKKTFADLLGIGGKPKAEEKKEEKPPVETKPTETAPAPGDGGNNFTMPSITPPREVQSNKNLKKWYEVEAGFIPGNWRKRPSIVPNEHGRAYKKVMSGQAGIPEAVGTVKKDLKELEGFKKDLETKHIASTTPIKQPAKDVMVVPASEKKGITDFLKDSVVIKAIDTHSNVIGDPKKFQEEEAKWPSFKEATGINLEDTFKWPPGVLLDFMKTFPHASALMAMALRTKYFNQLKEDKGTTKKDETVEPPPFVVEEEPVKKVAEGGRRRFQF